MFVNTSGNKTLEPIKTSKYLLQYKDLEHKCIAHSTVDRELKFIIPVEDPDFTLQDNPTFFSHEGIPLATVNVNSSQQHVKRL